MPYSIKKKPVKSGKDYAIIAKDTGKIVGRSKTREAAKKSVRARYAHEND